MSWGYELPLGRAERRPCRRNCEPPGRTFPNSWSGGLDFNGKSIIGTPPATLRAGELSAFRIDRRIAAFRIDRRALCSPPLRPPFLQTWACPPFRRALSSSQCPGGSKSRSGCARNLKVDVPSNIQFMQAGGSQVASSIRSEFQLSQRNSLATIGGVHFVVSAEYRNA
jgi:hypothetical protein